MNSAFDPQWPRSISSSSTGTEDLYGECPLVCEIGCTRPFLYGLVAENSDISYPGYWYNGGGGGYPLVVYVGAVTW